MIRILIAGLLSLSFLCSYETLKDLGDTFEIEDKDLFEEFKKEYDKIDKARLKQELIARAKDQLIGKVELPSCRKTQTRIVKKAKPKEFVFEEMDLKFTADELKTFGFKESFAILDVERKKDLEWAFKKLKPSSKIIISRGNIETKKLGNFMNRYILDKHLAQRAEIRCTPTIITFEDNQYKLKEINIADDLNLKGAKE